MSYILDALRRADSERERGQVPGIHALPMPPTPDDAAAAPRAARWVWVLAVIGTLLAGVLAWVLATTDAPMRAPPQVLAPATPAPVRPVVADPAGAPAAPPTAHAGDDASARPASTTASNAAPATPGTTLPRGAGESATSALPATSAAPATPVAAGASPIAREAAAPAPTPRTAAAGPAAAPGPGPSAAIEAEPRIHALHELPEEVRRAIPPLVVNGSVYSKNPADRFLIVNGQIVHEAEPVAPDVMLEKIGQRAAVLNVHGLRFEISY